MLRDSLACFRPRTSSGIPSGSFPQPLANPTEQVGSQIAFLCGHGGETGLTCTEAAAILRIQSEFSLETGLQQLPLGSGRLQRLDRQGPAGRRSQRQVSQLPGGARIDADRFACQPYRSSIAKPDVQGNDDAGNLKLATVLRNPWFYSRIWLSSQDCSVSIGTVSPLATAQSDPHSSPVIRLCNGAGLTTRAA